MNMPLQDFSPGKSNYERPTLGWTCGKNADGEPCSIGPSSGGDCQVYLECVPAKDAGGYICSRAPAFGGKCEKGPLPDGNCRQPLVTCHPRRTLFARRRIVTTTLAGLALGVLLCTFGGKAAVRNAVTSPGALTLQHASSKQTCESCHDRATAGFDELTDLLTSAGSVALADSENCQVCHDFGPNALNPHSLDVDKLATLTKEAAGTGSTGTPLFLVSLATQLAGSPMKGGQLACSRCHKEHRGEFFDLTRMADAQCQVCHTGSFHGFNSGHPPFSGFPYTRRTRIHFDHTTHYRIHFANFKRLMPNGRTPENCETCHRPDPAHQTMPVVGFGQACGSCHDEQFENPLDAIEFLALPHIDLELLKDEEIGMWPEPAALASSDNGQPAFMRLLLEIDETRANARQVPQLAAEDGDAAKVRAQVQIVWATKHLINDLVQNGEEALRRRLSASLGDAGRDRTLIRALAGDGAFLEAVETASALWFPDLEDELTRHDAGEPLKLKEDGDDQPASDSGDVPSDETADGSSDKPTGESRSGWTMHAESIAYVPSGHADQVVQVLIEALVSVPDVTTIADPSKPQATHQLFSMLTSPGASFGCMKCHTVDALGETTVVNWHGRRQTSRNREFIRFSHAPHVTLLARGNTAEAVVTKRECAYCHHLNHLRHRAEVFVHSDFIRRPAWDSAYVDLPELTANTDPHITASSGFTPVRRELCGECHTRKRAGESCLKCHNYHVGHFSSRASPAIHVAPPEGSPEESTVTPDVAAEQ
jgi:hypothetical protein